MGFRTGCCVIGPLDLFCGTVTSSPRVLTKFPLDFLPSLPPSLSFTTALARSRQQQPVRKMAFALNGVEISYGTERVGKYYTSSFPTTSHWLSSWCQFWSCMTCCNICKIHILYSQIWHYLFHWSKIQHCLRFGFKVWPPMSVIQSAIGSYWILPLFSMQASRISHPNVVHSFSLSMRKNAPLSLFLWQPNRRR